MGSADQPDGTSNSVVADLIAVEKTFAQAVVQADVVALNRLTSDDWIIISPQGSVMSKSAFLAVVKSGVLTHSAMDFDEIRVRTYGDTAVVTARAPSTGAYQEQVFTTRERSTDVFVRERGEWRCVLTQLTTIAEKQAHPRLRPAIRCSRRRAAGAGSLQRGHAPAGAERDR